MIYVITNEHNRVQPYLTCNHCNKPISNVQQGWCMWEIESDGSPRNGVVLIVHKSCSYAVEHARESQWRSMGLNVFLFKLGNALHINWPETIEQAKQLDELL